MRATARSCVFSSVCVASLAARQLHPAWRSSASGCPAVKENSLIELDFSQINGSYLFTTTLLVEVKLMLFYITVAFSKNTDRIICYPLSSNNQEQSSMVWPCHDERRRVSAEVCDEVKDTTGKIKTKVARQHR